MPSDDVDVGVSPRPLVARTKVEEMDQRAREATISVAATFQGILAEANERIEALEKKARDLAWVVETTRQETLLLSDKKSAVLEQKARDLADFAEALRDQTRATSEADFDALGQQARDLALSVESVRKETRLQSEKEIVALGQRARELALFVECGHCEKMTNQDSEIATLARTARDLAVCVEAGRRETLSHSDAEIEGLKRDARDLALSTEISRVETLMESDRVIRTLNADLEQRVLERTGQLEAANKELESFSYSVSHDLRAPLRAIDGFSRIVLEEHSAALAPEGIAFLKLVRDNTRQMGQLVDDLLQFSGLGRLALLKQPVDPGAMVRACLAEMTSETAGRSVEIVIGDLTPCRADSNLLKQVWRNLLSNALKYTRKKESARIEIGCQSPPEPATSAEPPGDVDPGPGAVYFVKDNGAGFDMRYAHKLFGVFQRLHRAADYEGTGVGLAIVQRIVSRHGGRVWGEAQLGRGATFSFTLQ